MIDKRWERNVTRRGFVAAGAATAFLAACGGSTDSESESDDSADKTKGAAELGGTMHYYNWADYVNPETYKNFTAETGVKIKKDFFVSNEELQAKLQGGARGFDLAAPTGYMVQILAEGGCWRSSTSRSCLRSRRTSTRSSRSCRTTPRTSGRCRRTGAPPVSCTGPTW